ncbi:MAG: HesA/MoeB/ThiF family protein [Bacteroidales bacterium]|jgi:adenylyltransferase/sulfurtransferase|nr:HesA/MoeB/ThiF family protein [Bacteroidales bacterium]
MGGDILSQRELKRYSRQIMIPEFGIEGQEKLKKSKVLVIGAGGLGCPVLQYVAAAGVGKVAFAEFDMVSEANLQRQILYGSDDVGKLKSVIAKKRLEALNSLIEFEIFNLRIDAGNSFRILKDFDVVVDATDNLETRYIINDTCVILNKPMVHGAIYKFEGQVSVFNYREGPTYRCYNPYVDDTDFKNPSPGEAGLLGVLPGITGSFMANEVIKIITGIGNILNGKVLLFNILNYSFHLITVKNIPENHNIRELSGYNEKKIE